MSTHTARPSQSATVGPSPSRSTLGQSGQVHPIKPTGHIAQRVDSCKSHLHAKASGTEAETPPGSRHRRRRQSPPRWALPTAGVHPALVPARPARPNHTGFPPMCEASSMGSVASGRPSAESIRSMYSRWWRSSPTRWVLRTRQDRCPCRSTPTPIPATRPSRPRDQGVRHRQGLGCRLALHPGDFQAGQFHGQGQLIAPGITAHGSCRIVRNPRWTKPVWPALPSLQAVRPIQIEHHARQVQAHLHGIRLHRPVSMSGLPPLVPGGNSAPSNAQRAPPASGPCTGAAHPQLARRPRRARTRSSPTSGMSKGTCSSSCQQGRARRHGNRGPPVKGREKASVRPPYPLWARAHPHRTVERVASNVCRCSPSSPSSTGGRERVGPRTACIVEQAARRVHRDAPRHRLPLAAPREKGPPPHPASRRGVRSSNGALPARFETQGDGHSQGEDGRGEVLHAGAPERGQGQQASRQGRHAEDAGRGWRRQRGASRPSPGPSRRRGRPGAGIEAVPGVRMVGEEPQAVAGRARRRPTRSTRAGRGARPGVREPPFPTDGTRRRPPTPPHLANPSRSGQLRRQTRTAATPRSPPRGRARRGCARVEDHALQFHRQVIGQEGISAPPQPGIHGRGRPNTTSMPKSSRQGRPAQSPASE